MARGKEPASCYRKVAGSMCLGQDAKPQIAPDVLGGTLHGSHCHQHMNVSLTVSCFGPKCLVNSLNVNVVAEINNKLL